MANQTAGESADQSGTQGNITTTAAKDDKTTEFKPITSQEEFDGLVGRRLAREREQAAKAEREKFGDYEELKQAAAKLAEIEEANKTELEKERDRAAKAEERAATIEAEARETRLRAAIISEAAKPDRKVIDTDAVVALLDRSTLELADDGTPTNIAQAMDSLLEQRPFLVASDGGARGNADQGARKGGQNQLGEDALKSMSPEEIDQAHKEGRFSELLGAKS